MKYVKVTIRKETDRARPRMQYPALYNAVDVDASRRGPLVYNQGIGKGGNIEEMMIFVEDNIADLYNTDGDMAIQTEAQVDIWLLTVERVQQQSTERVTDPDRMLAIQAKVAAIGNRTTITAEDLAALDPDNPILGINRRGKTAADIFA